MGIGVWAIYSIDFNVLKTNISPNKVILIVGLCVAIYLIWYITRMPKRVDRDKIGVAVAISTQNNIAQEQLKDDFIENLHNIVKTGHNQKIQIITLSEYHSKKIVDGVSARKYHIKTRSHLIIYGSCKLRMHEAKECFYLKLDASVLHGILPPAISNSISKEMRSVLPPNLIFRADEEIKAFRITASTLGHGARYIVGLASLFSGDIETAFDMHNGLNNEIDAIERDSNASLKDLATIKKLIPLHLSDEALILSEFSYLNKKIDKMGKYLEVVKRFDPHNYKAHLLRGIYYFLGKRDTKAALEEIRKSKNERDYTWQINEAFITAYEGDLEGAHKLYKRASLGILQSPVPLETESFIYEIVGLEPDKVQLWYCLGMINYFIKEDPISAKQCFSKFVELAENKKVFPSSISFAKKYLQEIEGKKKADKEA